MLVVLVVEMGGETTTTLLVVVVFVELDSELELELGVPPSPPPTDKLPVSRMSRLLAPTLTVKLPLGTIQFCEVTSQ